MIETMNVVSLFDGMSCGLLALVSAGIKVNNYYASEIDKYAMAVSKHNWPNEITPVGDITKWREWNIDWASIDLLIGGSPCQSFSIAGKQKGMATKTEEVTTLDRYLELTAQGVEFEGESHLFWLYVEIYQHIKNLNPDVHFLLENVKMEKKWEDVISDTMNIAPVLINSAKVSAQNRNRLYWTNICFDRYIKDRGIILADILDLDLPSDNIGIALREKSCTVRSSGRCSPFGTGHDWDSPYIKTDKKLALKHNQNKASCLTGGAHSGGNHSDMDILIYQYPRGKNAGGIIDTQGKAPTITSSRWEQNCKLVFGTRQVGRKINENGKRDDNNPNIKFKQRFELRTDDKSNCMTTWTKDSMVAVKTEQDHIIRRFTVRECCRLQTVPDDYLDDCKIGNRLVSNTQKYKMLGNGWTVEVIALILRGIFNPSMNQIHKTRRPQIQQDLFCGLRFGIF